MLRPITKALFDCGPEDFEELKNSILKQEKEITELKAIIARLEAKQKEDGELLLFNTTTGCLSLFDRSIKP